MWACKLIKVEASSEGDFDWHLGFWKYEEPCIYEGRQFCKENHVFGFGTKEKENKFLVICCCCFFFVGVVCINVLDKLQYLVALEGRMLKGVDGYTFEG